MSATDRDARASLNDRALILVQGARNGRVTLELLARAGVEAFVCASMGELCAEMEKGGAVALIAEEALTPHALAQISKVLSRQAAWSDFPIVVFVAGADAANGSQDLARWLGNVTFLDRPVRARSMLASVRSAIRSRGRQYEARRAIESRDTFLAMLGHELRNPLAAISLAGAVLEKNAPASSRPKEYAIINRQSRHLKRLVDDLLDVARITHGKLALQWQRLNLVEVVRHAHEALEPRAREHGLSWDLVCPDVELWVDGDRQRLEQVFTNLMTNAVKYTPSGGRVTVDVEVEGDLAVVAVKDTGIGIPPEMLDSVFDLFTQTERSLHRTEGGMGLGLTVVRSLVQLHRGKVNAMSKGPGQGSSFVVRLPLVHELALGSSSSKSPSEESSAARRVVVVEDSDDIRDLIAELLKRAGHEVACADDGPRGLETILKFGPDIAFVDLGLPGFDGLELARRARASGSTSRLVAVTGYGQAEDRKHAAEAGFDDHLTKPVIDDDLSEAILRLDAERRSA